VRHDSFGLLGVLSKNLAGLAVMLYQKEALFTPIFVLTALLRGIMMKLQSAA
jgi:hypothetical protein